MKHREPISTESYHYRVDESRRQAIQQHFDRDRLARINRGEQPGKPGWWAILRRRSRLMGGAVMRTLRRGLPDRQQHEPDHVNDLTPRKPAIQKTIIE